MLEHCEQLHLFAVTLSKQAHGEMNVQVAKHYGNLGRLYQTMQRYREAEKMHLKAIKIKETLLGQDDYDVALTIGHLASLYNYDLDEFDKAEELHLRSIDINIRHFGPNHSSLEYDYVGLIRLYEKKEDRDNWFKYTYLLEEWKSLNTAKASEENLEDKEVLHQAKRMQGGMQQIIQVIENLSY